MNKINLNILYINLDESKNRNEHMIKMFDKYNINKYIRIDAIDGKKIKNIYNDTCEDITFINKCIYKGHRNKNKGNTNKIACTLSHLKEIYYAKKNNYENVLIMEDDISLEYLDLWNTTIDNIILNAPDNCIIFQL